MTNAKNYHIKKGGQLMNSKTLEGKGNPAHSGLLHNSGILTLSGILKNSDGHLWNYAHLALGGQIINRDGATLTNSGKGAQIEDSSGSGEGIINTDLGTSLINQDGAVIHFAYAALNNRDGATLTNDRGEIRLENMGKLINSGSDTNLINQDGLLSNDGDMDSQIINRDGATLTNSGQSTLYIGSNNQLTNSGSGTHLINKDGAMLQMYMSSLNNLDGATLTNSGHGTVLKMESDRPGSMAGLTNGINSVINNQNDAVILINSQGFISNNGNINNSAAFNVTSSGNVSGSGVFKQTDGLLTVDGSMTQSAVNLLGGSLDGTGAVNSSVHVDGAVVAPGHSKGGTLTINGDLTFTSGSMSFDVGGFVAGQHGLLVINGATNFLAGTVLFKFINEFLPSAGEYFDFLRAATIVGLDNLKFECEGLPKGFHFDIDLIGGNTLRFTARKDG